MHGPPFSCSLFKISERKVPILRHTFVPSPLEFFDHRVRLLTKLVCNMRHAIAKIIAILNASRKGETSRSLKNDLFQIHCFTGKRQKRYILDERVV